MQEQEKNIQFDCMPDFGGVFSQQTNPDSTFDEKEYASLYDELTDKIHPNRFIDGANFDEGLFNEANRLYNKLLKSKGNTEEALIQIRNEAIEKLGIHISTKRKYEYLDGFLNPRVYIDVDGEDYDAERASEAAKWYSRLQSNRNDILSLEELEREATDFIDRRKSELSEKEVQREREEEAQRKRRSEEILEESKRIEKGNVIVPIFIFGVSIIITIIFALILN